MGDVSRHVFGRLADYGAVPTGDDSSIGTDLTSWEKFQVMLERGVIAGSLSDRTVVSTYSLVYTLGSGAYNSAVLASNGDIHFVPANANRGQKISTQGVVSTYSLIYTAANAYAGGVLAPNGDIYFNPLSAIVGQKITAAGVVSTYSLAYTTTLSYWGGVLAPNGDIHFVQSGANRGQKISTTSGEGFPAAVCQSPFFNKF